MNILIAYATRHGSTEKAAKILESKLSGRVTLHNFKRRSSLKLSEFDAIIVGGSIHAGQVQKKIKHFCNKNQKELSQKHLGLYLCCMDKEQAQMQFEKAYPEELREHATMNGLFGGEFLFDKMNRIEKYIIKKIIKSDENKSEIDTIAIQRFAEKFNLLPQ